MLCLMNIITEPYYPPLNAASNLNNYINKHFFSTIIMVFRTVKTLYNKVYFKSTYTSLPNVAEFKGGKIYC